jgi:uncharacterized cupin superfamily protein
MRSSSKPVSMLLALLLAACDSPATTLLEEAARNTAEQWLAKGDGGDHAGAWEMTTPDFRVQIRKEDWEARQETFYRQLGKPARRELIAAKYSASVPGVPEGEYVLIQYRRPIREGGPALETLTMRRAGDEWQTAGYWVVFAGD